MSYTRPSASAANLSWSGQAAYTRPAANAANLEFAASHVASGFTSTNFGTPTLAQHAVGFTSTEFGTPAYIGPHVCDATGFSDTQFGTPVADGYFSASGFTSTEFGSPIVVLQAVGFTSTQFGTPQVALNAVGFTSTQFGAPAFGRVCVATTLGRNTVVSMAYYAFGQTLDANGANLAGRFGRPLILQYLPQPVRASGWESTQLGTPVAVPTRVSVATGSLLAQTFGTPGSVATGRTLDASSLAPGATFGAAGALTWGQPAGIASGLNFGLAVVLGVTHASGLSQAARFGLPGVSRPNTYPARGLWLGNRVGHPAALRRNNKHADGVPPSATFGDPASIQRHRVTHLDPRARVGTPQLVLP